MTIKLSLLLSSLRFQIPLWWSWPRSNRRAIPFIHPATLREETKQFCPHHKGTCPPHLIEGGRGMVWTKALRSHMGFGVPWTSTAWHLAGVRGGVKKERGGGRQMEVVWWPTSNRGRNAMAETPETACCHGVSALSGQLQRNRWQIRTAWCSGGTLSSPAPFQVADRRSCNGWHGRAAP